MHRLIIIVLLSSMPHSSEEKEEGKETEILRYSFTIEIAPDFTSFEQKGRCYRLIQKKRGGVMLY